MKALFEGCRRSEIKVTPKNWNTQKAKIRDRSGKNFCWRIHYRFYDPNFQDRYPKGYPVNVKGMNDLHTLGERQAMTKDIIQKETEMLDIFGYHPITEVLMAPPKLKAPGQEIIITQGTGYCEALRIAFKACSLEDHTREDINSTLKYYTLSAKMLGFDKLPLKDITRQHIKRILDNCANLMVTVQVKGKKITRKKIWNANQFNHYRKYIGIIYKQLVKMQVLEYNPMVILDMAEVIKDEEEATRTVLTEAERVRIDVYLRSKPKLHSFRRYIHIFFHSGGRRTELFRVQGKHVDLHGQRYKVLIKKGRERPGFIKLLRISPFPFGRKLCKTVDQKIMFSLLDLNQVQNLSVPNRQPGVGFGILKIRKRAWALMLIFTRISHSLTIPILDHNVENIRFTPPFSIVVLFTKNTLSLISSCK